MSIELNITLENGLKVFIQESHAAPVVAVQVWVGAGSADERPEEAGIAHVIEHMMFKGTPRRGVGEIARAVEGAGGDINAFTSYDQTVYHITLAARHALLALDVLSDVIQSSLFDATELNNELEVVLEEVRRYRDVPGSQLSQAMFKTAFQTHPYGRPIIGYEETVRNFKREDLLAFYERWYTPQNMVVVVVGDIDATEIQREVTRLFQDFVRPTTVTRARAPEPEQTSPRYTELQMPVQEGYLALAFPAPNAEHPDTPLLDLLALILGQGESSRLVEKIRNQKQLVNSIGAYAYTPFDAGMFMLSATFETSRLAEVYEALLEELEQLKHAPPRASELRKAKSILQSDRVYSRETVDGRARKFGYGLLSRGGLEREKAYYQAIEEASVESLWQVARTWLDPNTLNLAVLLPKEATLPNGQELLELGQGRLQEARKASAARLAAKAEAETVRFTLPNGIRLLVRQNHSVPLVAVRAIWEGGLRFEKSNNNGAFQLMSTMLTRGTQRRKSYEIAHEVESLAGGLDGFSGRNSFGLRGEFLSHHLERGMELFAEVLKEPSFDPHELELMRRMTLEAIRTQSDHPGSYVFKLFGETLFTRHPLRLAAIGTEASVRTLTSTSMKRLWQQYARSEGLVISVVGDVDPQDMEGLTQRLLGDFQPGAARIPEVAVEPPLKKTRARHMESDKNQMHQVLGWRGLGMEHPDRVALQALSSILSGQGGRLFVELRDKQSLAYSVTAMSLEALGEGYFAVYIASDPSKTERARRGILTEIDKVLQDGVTQAELERTQRYLVGSYEIDLQRASALCANMAFNECYGLGADDYKRYPQRVQAVTCEQIQTVARQLLSTSVYALSSVGPASVVNEAESEEG